jgi:hypothetical protein
MLRVVTVLDLSRADLVGWVRRYEHAWRSPGTDRLAELFAPEATYSQGPFEAPVVGLSAIARMWDAEREGPDEEFTMSAEPVAVEGRTGVVRVHVEYRAPAQEWADLWIITLDDSLRCTAFEEWPVAPD